MHIGIVIFGSLETLTGGYLYDRKLVDHLRCQGHEVKVISKPYHGYPCHLLDNFLLPLVGQLRQLPLDILLQDEIDHGAFFLLNRRLRAMVSYPIISIVHHLRSNEQRPTWQNHLYRYIEHRYLMTADGFVFNSQTTRHTVESIIGTEHPSVVAYPSGDRLPTNITEEEIAARAKQPGPLRLVFLGNVIRRKELHTLLAALAQLPKDTCTLTVVGSLFMDKPYVHAIRRQLTDSGLADRVVLLGSVPDTELVARLRESHVLVVPSSYEGFGIVYLEGMGFGLPAIASTAGGASEIIAPGKDGFLISPGDSATLAQHLYELSQNRDRLLSMSLNARRHFESHPTWQMTMERILMFLETMMENDV
ncbi:MAG: glycosyltransferase family 4 protein [Chloroflexota bacterium]